MKIINQLTLNYLKENKKRTILTILCIAVSVIMISCVGISFYSGKQFYKEYIEKTVGDYHYNMITNQKEVVDIIKKDNQVQEYYFSSSEPFYKDKNLDNQTFMNLKRGDSLYYQKENYKDLLIEGRLPHNGNEIAISQYYFENSGIDKKIGDKISLYNNDNEKTYTFNIVGIINQYKASSLSKKSFDALSYIDLNDPNVYFTMYVQNKNLTKDIFSHISQLQNKIGINSSTSIYFNSSYLAIQDVFEDNSHSMFLGAYKLIAAILMIIILLSVFIIYQAFNLSTNDRIQYLGMISSVGATPKQKKRSVYFEGLLLSLIAIPLGIIMSFIGLYITFLFINQLDIFQQLNIQIQTSISIEYLLIVIIIVLTTISISLYLPARKISKISVIDALKKNDEIKVSKHRLKSGMFSKRFLNISWQLALKNYKRQGRRSKVIVFSLVISMVAFVSVFSFGQSLMKQSAKAQRYKSYDIEVNISDDSQEIAKMNKILKQNDKVDEYYYQSHIRNCYASIKKSDIAFPIDQSVISPLDDYLPVLLIGLNQEKLEDICKENDIEYKEGMAIVDNSRISNNEASEYFPKRFHQANDDFIESLMSIEIQENGNESIRNLSLFSSYTLLDFTDVIDKDDYCINIIVPIDYILSIESDIAHNISFYIQSSQYNDLEKDLLFEGYSAYNYAQSVSQNRQMFMVIQIFIYGFVLIMIFFTVLNIINMMSASIDKRKKEFGMMLSIGMSPKGIQKMIMEESFIYGLKTLLYGVPISIMIEWIMFKQITMKDENFVISYIGYIISFIVIMIVMLLTFRTALNKFKKQNIIETLKDDM